METIWGFRFSFVARPIASRALFSTRESFPWELHADIMILKASKPLLVSPDCEARDEALSPHFRASGKRPRLTRALPTRREASSLSFAGALSPREERCFCAVSKTVWGSTLRSSSDFWRTVSKVVALPFSKGREKRRKRPRRAA